MKHCLIILFCILSLSSCDLGFKDEQGFLSECMPIYRYAETMPQLIGGLAALQRQVQYPQEALNLGIEGRVIVQFIVDKKGAVLEPKIKREIGGGADEEAKRAVQNSRFVPGSQDGEPVCTEYSLPIVFRISN